MSEFQQLVWVYKAKTSVLGMILSVSHYHRQISSTFKEGVVFV